MTVINNYFKKGDLFSFNDRSCPSWYKIVDIDDDSIYYKGCWWIRSHFIEDEKYKHIRKIGKSYSGITKIPIKEAHINKIRKNELRELIDIEFEYFNYCHKMMITKELEKSDYIDLRGFKNKE